MLIETMPLTGGTMQIARNSQHLLTILATAAIALVASACASSTGDGEPGVTVTDADNGESDATAGTTADTQSVDAEAPSPDTEATPSDTEAPPSDTEATPSDTEAPPSDTEAPPSDTETPPSDTEAPPSDTGEPVADVVDTGCEAGTKGCNGQVVEVCNQDGETWTAIATCPDDTACFEGSCCEPSCDGTTCESDGCGGTCACPDGDLCFEGSCCQPTCDGVSCGSDVCGVACECLDGDVCSGGICVLGCDEAGALGCNGDTVTLCSSEGIPESLIDCATMLQTCKEGLCVEPDLPTPDCPDECTGQTMEAALCALDICYESLSYTANLSSPTGATTNTAWQVLEQYGSLNDLVPQAAPSFLAMGTGDLDAPDHMTQLIGSAKMQDPFAATGNTNGNSDIQDVLELTLTMTAPVTATGFSLDVLFMSIEYKSYVGSGFSDNVYLILDAPVTTEDTPRVINYTACTDIPCSGCNTVPTSDTYFDFEDDDGQWCYLGIYTAQSEYCDGDVTVNLDGTGFECPNGTSTGWLRTTHPIASGETFTLTLHIHDAVDQTYDSAALFDNFQWLTGEVAQQTVPIATPNCVPECDGKVCGDDGCYGSCGACDDGQVCGAGQCMDPIVCVENSPQGCNEGDCPDGQLCDTTLCGPTNCACDPTTGLWACTEDCDLGTCVPDGDLCEDAFVIDSIPFSASGDTASASADYSVEAGDCPGLEGGAGLTGRDQVYHLVVPADRDYQITVESSDAPDCDALGTCYSPLVYVVTDCSDTSSCLAAYNAAAPASFVVTLEQGTDYFVIVDHGSEALDAPGAYSIHVSEVCEEGVLTDCLGACAPDTTGDGVCDEHLNCVENTSDGGDCCPADTILDCVGGCTHTSWSGDNACDPTLNCAATMYDSGDCDCPETHTNDCLGICFDTSLLGDGTCNDGGEAGLWPTADFYCEALAYDAGDCVACEEGSIVDCLGQCSPNTVGNGECDPHLQCAKNDDDGGDCVTCEEGYIKNCTSPPGCTLANWLGDGICDNDLKCAEMNWDDGDCPEG